MSANLSRANLHQANLHYTNLSGAKLDRANFTRMLTCIKQTSCEVKYLDFQHMKSGDMNWEKGNW
ncbi:hypothetical protein PI95_011745 [Hassallia byssoidea VB512170]|uniref:Pentapeptide repeat-containing protein n=1 Tax=Hassallia byssoidea VB512170 TaxID=1304833 RepID=A0A846H6E8_9CYAN|nr:pentapeptide repeat-containing protein [Hassalia byssoidea]NEU73217.1 hypothetical protein [Hassalia byssoidea VB512170]